MDELAPALGGDGLDEYEALRRFFLFTYEEAANAVHHHQARTSGGQHVGVARMPYTVAQRIVRDAQHLGLGLGYGADGSPVVTFPRTTQSNGAKQ